MVQEIIKFHVNSSKNMLMGKCNGGLLSFPPFRIIRVTGIMKKKQFGLILPPSPPKDEFEDDVPVEDPNSKYPTLKYKIPAWGSICPEFEYYLEVIKSGEEVERVSLSQDAEFLDQHKGWLLLGRLPPQDELPHYSLLHESVSRQHAIIQVNNF